MKFLYKIHSGYDGFTPKRIPERLVDGKLSLGWTKYTGVLELGHEVWVYFHGPHKFEPGVYARGFVETIDEGNQRVLLKLRQYAPDTPLTDPVTSARVASVVKARRYTQVFLYPEEWDPEPECDVDASAESCAKRECERCPRWSAIPTILPSHHGWPSHLESHGGRLLDAFAPAYWVIPSRCYLHREGREAARGVKQSTELFYRFKTGEKGLAFPLARGMYEALRVRNELDFDTIVPIPLSPEKANRGEIDRTLLLAVELARLLGSRAMSLLSLSSPISKRVLRSAGYTAAQFRDKYYSTLEIEEAIDDARRVLIVDDVCTEGDTIRAARRKILERNKNCYIAAATAGQMILKTLVLDESLIVA